MATQPPTLNLSSRGLTALPVDAVVPGAPNVDISGNSLTSLAGLEPIAEEIVTLNASKNRLDERSEIPYMPKLRSLYVASNAIRFLDIFVERLCMMAPGIEELVLVGNPCHPGVLESAAKSECRIYLAARFPALRTADGTPIRPTEREAARRLLALVGLD